MGYHVKPLGLPVREPVTLAEMKAHLTLDASFTADDLTLGSMIAAARQAAEDFLGKTLVPRRWLFARDQFPVFRNTYAAPSRSDLDPYGGYSGAARNDSQTIILPRPPLLSVDALRYIDTSGSLVVFPAVGYQVDTISQPGRILPGLGMRWPETAAMANAVQVEYTAGFAQTVTETAMVPGTGPYTVTVAQAAAFSGVLSVRDADTSALIPANQWLVSLDGALTFTSAWAGHMIMLEYRVLDLPPNAQMAIKLRAATFYANREEFVGGSSTPAEPGWFEDMLEQSVGRTGLFGLAGVE